MGEGGSIVSGPIDSLRYKGLKASLKVMKALNKLPFIDLNGHIENLGSYLDMQELEGEYTIVESAKKVKKSPRRKG